MYFVLSVNTRTQAARIVGHTDGNDLEEAIREVRNCARAYVLKKSEPMMQRDHAGPLPKIRTVYFMSDSKTNIHQIDVYSQKTERIQGWLGGNSEKSETAKLIRRFMYCHYDAAIPTSPVPEEQILLPPQPPKVKRMSPTKTLPVGGFPTSVIEDLIESGQFKLHRETADQNSMPKRVNIFDDFSDSSFDSE